MKNTAKQLLGTFVFALLLSACGEGEVKLNNAEGALVSCSITMTGSATQSGDYSSLSEEKETTESLSRNIGAVDTMNISCEKVDEDDTTSTIVVEALVGGQTKAVASTTEPNTPITASFSK